MTEPRQPLIDQPAATGDRILVVPSDPDASFLLEKVASSSPECGARMPLSEELDAAQIECIST